MKARFTLFALISAVAFSAVVFWVVTAVVSSWQRERAVRDLVDAVRCYDYVAISNGAESVRQLHGTNAAAKALVELKNDETVAGWHIIALSELVGPGETDALPLLVEALQHSDSDVRGWAAIAIGKIGSDAKSAVPMLMKLLYDRDAATRVAAAHALGQIGPQARRALPLLHETLERDHEEIVRIFATSALAKIDP
jgi:HEAT repeat protein